MLRASATQSRIDIIVDLGMRAHPNEACGLILPDNTVVQIENIAEHPTWSYVLDPAGFREALEDFIESQETQPVNIELDSVIVWHTHPGGNVGPSEGDLAERLDQLRYLVVALPSGEAIEF